MTMSKSNSDPGGSQAASSSLNSAASATPVAPASHTASASSTPPPSARSSQNASSSVIPATTTDSPAPTPATTHGGDQIPKSTFNTAIHSTNVFSLPATNALRSQLANASFFSASLPSSEALAAFGVSKSTAATAPNLKRKSTDPNIKIVNLNPHYDLTLIVGTTERSSGQIAFQVNKGSLRLASDIWTRMLSGPWAEKERSEIRFPDDCPWAFLQVLRTAHLQIAQLPAAVSLVEMTALAVLTDKYNLVNLMKVALNCRLCWLNTARNTTWLEWPANPYIQDWAFITHVFQQQNYYEHLVCKLAVEVDVDHKDVSLYYGAQGKRTKLRSTLPDRILKQIHHTRTSILQEWSTLCNAAISEAIRQDDSASPAHCGKATCKATKIGILMMGLQAAGFYPVPENAQLLYRSVTWYWKALKSIGADFKTYKPCDGTLGYGKGSHYSSCSSEKCLGDFGVITKAEVILKQYVQHPLVLTHLLSDKFMKDST